MLRARATSQLLPFDWPRPKDEALPWLICAASLVLAKLSHRMIRLDRPALQIALPLSLLAGYVDALGFIDLGGFFVSFMSGNSTRLGIGIGQGNLRTTAAAIAILALFVLGVVIGSLAATKAGKRRRVVVFAMVACLLSIAAILHLTHHVRLGTAALVLAMGAENTALRRDGVSVGLTYMTGNLVKLGHALADAITTPEKWLWLPYLSLWVALVAGAALGAVAHRFIDMNGLWFGVVLAAILALLSALHLKQGDRGQEAA